MDEVKNMVKLCKVKWQITSNSYRNLFRVESSESVQQFEYIT
jgi:hypothetical protein